MAPSCITERMRGDAMGTLLTFKTPKAEGRELKQGSRMAVRGPCLPEAAPPNSTAAKGARGGPPNH